MHSRVLAVWVKGVSSRCRCLFEYVIRELCVYKRGVITSPPV